MIVRLTLDMTGIIITAAGLAFLGFGQKPPAPEWGAMVSSRRSVILDEWWVATIPGIAIFLANLGFNLLGDGLRDLTDPTNRLSSRLCCRTPISTFRFLNAAAATFTPRAMSASRSGANGSELSASPARESPRWDGRCSVSCHALEW